MTVRDGERFVAEAIDSMVAQSYPEWELVVWNDGSSDRTAAIVADYGRRESRIRVVHSQPLGRRRALSEAHAQVKGELIGWLDADDSLAVEALAKTVSELRRDPQIGMVYTDHVIVDACGRRGPVGRRSRLPFGPHRLLLDFMTFHFRLIRREAFERAGGIGADLEIAIDYDLCLRLSEVARIRHLAEPLYFYRHHPTQMSHRARREQILGSTAAIRAALARRGLARVYDVEADVKTGRFRLVDAVAPRMPERGPLLQRLLRVTTPARRLRGCSDSSAAERLDVACWPAWSQDVYQRELYDAVLAGGGRVRRLGSTLAALLGATGSGRIGGILHIHEYERSLADENPSSALANRLLFMAALDLLRLRGVRIVWLDRDLRNAVRSSSEAEWQLRAALARRCWRVVRHSLSSTASNSASRQVPHRVQVVAHPHFIDAHPVVSRDYACAQLGLRQPRTTLLHYGELPAVHEARSLLAVLSMLRNRDGLRLLFAVPRGGHGYDGRSARELVRDPLVRVAEIDEHEVPVYFTAADAVLFPFRSTLRWDNVVLAMSMMKPIVAPDRLASLGIPRDNPLYALERATGATSLRDVLEGLQELESRHGGAGRRNVEQCRCGSWEALMAATCPRQAPASWREKAQPEVLRNEDDARLSK